MLYGRDAELAATDALLEGAERGAGGAVLVEGEAGIGKTALLAEARRRAGELGMDVLGATGIESEARLPFAALIELAAPLRDRLDGLDSPSAAALRTALEPAPPPGAPGDRLGVFAGILELLRDAAGRRPLLVCVDDAHWLDRSSAECLGYAARRLSGSRVAMLFASRPPIPVALADALSRHPLGALSREDARRLLAATAGDIDSRRANAILDVALGNPLALVSLPRMLVLLGGGEDEVDPLVAAKGGFADALVARVARLDGPERTALLVASSASDDRAAPTVAAAADLGAGPAAFESLEDLGLIVLEGDRIELAHPLLRGVAHRAVSGRERREAHRALAKRTGADVRAWHLAAAAVGFDEDTALALELAGVDATARGAHETAADTMARAAELSSDPDDRARRLFAAGLAAAMGGDFPRAAELLERAAETDVPALRAAVAHLDALVALTGGTRPGPDNRRRLSSEAERISAHDRDLATAMLADAAVVAVAPGELEVALELAERAAAELRPEAPPTVRCQVASILGMALALRGRAPEARAHLDRASELLAEVDPLSPAAQSILFAMGGRLSTGQESRLRDEARELAGAARRSSSVGLLPYFQLQAADGAYRVGELEAAIADAEQAVEVARESHQAGPLSIALAVQSRVQATLGRTADARRAAREGARISVELGYASPEVWNRAALGFAELGRGRTAEAIGHLEQVERLAATIGLLDPSVVPWAPDLIEAYLAEGRHQDARRVADTLDEMANRARIPLASALASRCRGMIAEDDAFEPEFERALELGDQAGLPLERARTLLAFGVRLARTGARNRARTTLREALGAFEELGARGWTFRARAELRNAGAAQIGAPEAPILTAQQTRIATAVAHGAKNREVAEQLVLSPKTVEYHLDRIYRKLGIRGRAELAALVASGELDREA